VLIYSMILVGLTSAMVFSMAVREPLKVDVIRDRVSLARIVAGGKLENVYRLQVMNATEQAQTYSVAVKGLEGIAMAEGTTVDVDSAQTRGVAVRVQIPYGTAEPGSHPIEFEITAQSGKGHVLEKSVFLVPR
jgi:Polyferredoxin